MPPGVPARPTTPTGEIDDQNAPQGLDVALNGLFMGHYFDVEDSRMVGTGPPESTSMQAPFSVNGPIV